MDVQTYFSMRVTIAAGRTIRIPANGNFVIILTNSSVTNPEIGIGGQSFYELPAGVGVPYIDGFSEVYFKNPSVGVMTLFIAVCTGQIQDTRVNVDALLTAIQRELQGDLVEEGYGETAVGLAFVQIIAANAARCGCSIQAKNDNAGIIYVGFDNTVAANNWAINLAANEAFVWDDYRGDVYAIASVAAQNVGWGEW